MGPIAPKDPVRQRQFYYIMLDKQISIFPFPDGKNASVIFANDNRLVSSSKYTGNVTDEEMLKLVTTTEGIKKLVYGIGVSMISGNGVGAHFSFTQNSNNGEPGTTIGMDITGDGVEYLLPLGDYEWKDNDKEPGNFTFEFKEANVKATVNVRFYLNDGFTAPPFEGIDKVDLNSDGYKNMIKKSLVEAGDYSRLKKCIAKTRAGEDVAITFIGGSITQGAGSDPINTECYSYKTYEGFKKRFATSGNVEYVKAGVGGTPSELGMVRFDKDLIKFGTVNPDIVVIEFAVNDAGDETGGDCYEGLIRRCLNLPGNPAVILLYSVFVDDYNLEKELMPIGRFYNLPLVSLKQAVTPQFYLSKDEGRVIGKNAYFYDCYHPANIGHTIMADCILNLFDEVDKMPEYTGKKSDGTISAMRSADFEEIHMIDRTHNDFGAVINPGSFTGTDKQLQACQMDTSIESTPQFPDNWAYVKGGAEPFAMDVRCKSLLIVTKDSFSAEESDVDIYVNDKFVKTVNPREIGWIHCNSQIIIRGEKMQDYHVEVRIREENRDKNFTILGFGIAVD